MLKTVGILGGGQLGAMLGERLLARGARVRVFDADPGAPAVAKMPDGATVARFDDAAALERFARDCDVVTCEFENVPAASARLVERYAPMQPSAQVLATAQHRAREKEFLRRSGLPHAAWTAAACADALLDAAVTIGFPLVVKTAFGGYDGKGQCTACGPEALAGFAATARSHGFGDVGFVLEERIDLASEISCIVARRASGESVAFPVFENLHREHVLDFTLLPARVSDAVQRAAAGVALEAARALGVVGLLTVEFFLSRCAPRAAHVGPIDGVWLLVNELAPRPHNSGHVTRVACTMDQFDALARVLLDQPLEAPRPLRAGAFCMGNLLGHPWRAGMPLPPVETDASAALCERVLYGKTEARPLRKMGHFTVCDATPDLALERARALRTAWETR